MVKLGIGEKNIDDSFGSDVTDKNEGYEDSSDSSKSSSFDEQLISDVNSSSSGAGKDDDELQMQKTMSVPDQFLIKKKFKKEESGLLALPGGMTNSGKPAVDGRR